MISLLEYELYSLSDANRNNPFMYSANMNASEKISAVINASSNGLMDDVNLMEEWLFRHRNRMFEIFNEDVFVARVDIEVICENFEWNSLRNNFVVEQMSFTTHLGDVINRMDDAVAKYERNIEYKPNLYCRIIVEKNEND